MTRGAAMPYIQGFIFCIVKDAFVFSLMYIERCLLYHRRIVLRYCACKISGQKSSSAFNGNVIILLHLSAVRLGYGQPQDTVRIFGMNIFLLYSIAHIEASAAAAGIPLSADIAAILSLLIVVYVLGCCHGQVSVLQLYLDVVGLESRQVDVQLIGLIRLFHIGPHQTVRIGPCRVIISGPRKIKEIIKQIYTKNAGE